VTARINPAWEQNYEARRCAGLRGRAKSLGIDVSEYVERSERKLRAWVEGVAIRIRVKEPGLTQFLRDEKYKVMEETGVSGGDLQTRERRRKVEQEILDIPVDASGSERPVSGYLEGSDETGPITNWGLVVLELDPDVRSRTWFLLGDLVDTPTRGGGAVLIPQPISHPSMRAAGGKTDIASAKGLPDACGEHRYAEALIYGGITPNDLKRVVYTQGQRPSEEVRAFARTAQWELSTTDDAAPTNDR